MIDFMETRRIASSLVLTGMLGMSAEVRAAQAASAEAPAAVTSPIEKDGFRARRGYLHLAPGIVSLELSPRVIPRYMWGFGLGYHHALAGGPVLEVGGFFEHVLDVRDGPSTNLVGIGPELRFGGGRSRVFGYGLLRLGVWFARRLSGPGPAADPISRVYTMPAALGTIGCGIQGLVHRHVALGGEPALDLLAARGAAEWMFRLRFFVSVLF